MLDKAVKEEGFFGNQNTVCRPIAFEWRSTVELLKNRFPEFDMRANESPSTYGRQRLLPALPDGARQCSQGVDAESTPNQPNPLNWSELAKA